MEELLQTAIAFVAVVVAAVVVLVFAGAVLFLAGAFNYASVRIFKFVLALVGVHL